MEGRPFAQWILLGSAAVAAGCKTTTTPAANPMPQSANNSSMIDRAFAKGPPGPMKPVATEPEPEMKGPLKSETVAVLADLAVEAAFNNENLTPAERDRRLDEMRQRYQAALHSDPKNVEALRGLGRLYTRLGDREHAAQIYQTAMQLHPKNAMLAHEAALSYGRFEDWQTALALWQHALTVDPESRKYPRMIGLAQARLGNYEAGFNELIKVCSEAEARTVMARELLDAGQTAAGMQQLELARKADPEFGPAKQMMEQMHGNVQQAGYQQ